MKYEHKELLVMANSMRKAGKDGRTIGISTLPKTIGRTGEVGDVGQTGFVAVEIRNKKEG